MTTREELDKFVAEQEAQTGTELAVTDHPAGAQGANGHAVHRLTIMESDQHGCPRAAEGVEFQNSYVTPPPAANSLASV